jgi:ribonuclease BN (tRNA processing enzyme)
MVDPPPYSTLLLRKMGIPSKFVRWIIISHTHADHDAGAFQKLLESEKIELITTRTIMESFVRKYSALTDLPQEYIKTLFDFRPVKIGHATRVNGAEFQFFYALHSIPTVGFYVKILDKSIYFSGDTYYDPEGYFQKLFYHH